MEHVKYSDVAMLLWTALFFSQLALGHPVGPLGAEPLDWNTEQISGVIAGGTLVHSPARVAIVQGRKCLMGNDLHFNVRDEYAFDIDESVDLDVEFYLRNPRVRVTVAYEKSGVEDRGPTKEALLPADTSMHWHKEHFVLDRARFANSGFSGTDLLIYGRRAPPVQPNSAPQPEITVCSVSLRRSYATPEPQAYGGVNIETLNEHGQSTAARLGIYDPSGRLPLPSHDALALRNFDDVSRVIKLRSGSVPWPYANRSVFYVKGQYRARLPVGDYQLIAAKGLEYRLQKQLFTVKADAITSIQLRMQRWNDMAARGWYSGDGHVHYTRENAGDDATLLSFVGAEDLHVANVLQMGNSGTTHFRQHAWQTITDPQQSSFVLIPGQEDPRTVRHGHTIQLHLNQPIRDPSHYLLYHEVFEKARAQGGITGYAHSRDRSTDRIFGSRRGMAVDVPFGLVDFVEVMQLGELYTDTWFDFLNLGYRLSPSAGTDYPYVDVPGAVRTYVKVANEFTPRAWLDELKSGSNFVTNGPIIEFSINGRESGSELQVHADEDLVINAKVSINPDIDRLDRLEIVEQGDVVKSISSASDATQLELRHTVSAAHGTWFVVRAFGKQNQASARIAAVSAPIYVFVDGQGFWKPAAVPSIVAGLKEDMRELLTPLSSHAEIENWDTRDPDVKFWMSQRPLLQKRIAQVSVLYDQLIERARRETQR